MQTLVNDFPSSIDNRAVAAATRSCGGFAAVRAGDTGRRVAMASGTGIRQVSVIYHGRVVPVRLYVRTPGSAVFQSVAMAVDTGTGGSLCGSSIGVAGKRRKPGWSGPRGNADSDSGRRGLNKSQGARIVAQIVERVVRAAVKRLGGDQMALVALQVLHVSGGEVLEVGADPQIGAALDLVCAGAGLAEAGGEKPPIGIALGDCRVGGAVAVGAGVIGVDRCVFTPAGTALTAVAGSIVAGLGRAAGTGHGTLVRSVGAVGNVGEKDRFGAVTMVLDAGVVLERRVVGSGLAMAELAVDFSRQIFQVLAVGS